MFMEFESLFLIICIVAFPIVDGCGQIAPGRERAINFTLTDFKLPAAMVYYENAMARARVATISTTKNEAEGFVRTLIMQTVDDVLYEQGRSAFLSDFAISSILQQLEVQISYDPLKCDSVITEPMAAMNNAVGMKMVNCIIIVGTVTNICSDMDIKKCEMAMIADNLKPIDRKHLTISGSLKTSNSIMANWSNQMWDSVLNRVLRRITSSQFGSYFYGASINIK